MTSPAFPYQLVATDLDGTLLRSDKTISERNRAALASAQRAGAAHIVVTGRAVPWARHILDSLDYTGLAVCGQGAQLYDAGAHRLLTSVTMDRRTARAAIEKLEGELGPLLVAVSRDGLDGEVVTSPGYRLESPLPIDVTDDPERLWAEPITRAYIQHDRLDDSELYSAAVELVGGIGGTVDVTHAGDDTVELLPPGLSKATGLNLAARRLKVTAPGTIAFGDMLNDLPMFAWAGHSVAMGNAHPEVKEAADEVTAGNDEDGVALVLERLTEK
ncbi:hydrolase [Mangrovactinospora gilvigrisea]|uniref:Hydrolase n=1 Tax=Mangrovactinospora gilvigrisea TaxID=1428644 RepID=A0A1J7CFJ9_9ACTN|nr:Cof-type HAD-IIB family hydrolase [Mangrovactinospora gilvigrisea]OIV38466.1 hydrolase [Mangrovactinospora gilvigrisea]